VQKSAVFSLTVIGPETARVAMYATIGVVK